MSKNAYAELYGYLVNEVPSAKYNLVTRLRACGQAGLFRHAIASKLGGHGDSFVKMCLVHEELGSESMDSSLIVAMNAHIWSCIFPMLAHGTPEQQDEYLESLLSGKILAAQAMTEPDCGSDITALATIAHKTNDGYILNGRKKYITNVPIADLIVVYARDEDEVTAFLVKPSDHGITCSSLDMDGFSSSEIGEIILTDCLIPSTRVLGKPKHGLAIFKKALELERAFIFSGIVGVMKKHIATITTHVNKRKSDGKALIRNQSISHKLTEMNMLIETMRLWIYKSARMCDQKKRMNLVSSYTKLYASEACLQYYLHAVQILGASGLHQPYHLSQSVLDALSGRLMSGTSEVQRNIISALTGVEDSFLPAEASCD